MTWQNLNLRLNFFLSRKQGFFIKKKVD